MKLTSMIAYVDSLDEPIIASKVIIEAAKRFQSCCKYKDFLKQPLELGFFIPCGKDGEPLEEPKELCNCSRENCKYRKAEKEYQQAQERVLFEGFKFGDVSGFKNSNTLVIQKDGNQLIAHDKVIVENLITFKPTLTPNAIKMIE